MFADTPLQTNWRNRTSFNRRRYKNGKYNTKEVAVAAAMAIVTTAAVAVAKGVGADIAGTAATVGYVIITNMMVKQARRK
jgi:hypothetical protein